MLSVKGKKMRWELLFGKYGERREEKRMLVVIYEGKKSLGIYRHRWDDDIEFDFQDTEWGVYKVCIGVCEDTDSLWAIVDVGVKSWVSDMWGNVLLAEELSAF